MSEFELREAVKEKLSESRFAHTEGVVRAAKILAAELLPEKIEELTAAAYLHDIAKELSTDELISLSTHYGYEPTDDDISSPQVLHAFAAPSVILESFPEFAKSDIMSSVFKHTTGDSEMSVFDEIIFISDYIEDGRKYPSCISVREYLFDGLKKAENTSQKEILLHQASLLSIEHTLESLKNREKSVNKKTLAAQKHLKQKISGR